MAIACRAAELRHDRAVVLLSQLQDPPRRLRSLSGQLDHAAQREPIAIRQHDRELAVVLSMVDHEHLRSANVAALLDRRDEAAAA